MPTKNPLRKLMEKARALAPHLRAGKEGERLAAHYLETHGYRILATNVHLGKLGEIDIVAEEAGDLVIVEVKARRARGEYSAFLNITPAKRRKLVMLAKAYGARRGVEGRSIRFDVVGVEGVGEENPSVTLIPCAFREERR